jgi:hypothetical protein
MFVTMKRQVFDSLDPCAGYLARPFSREIVCTYYFSFFSLQDPHRATCKGRENRRNIVQFGPICMMIRRFSPIYVRISAQYL